MCFSFVQWILLFFYYRCVWFLLCAKRTRDKKSERERESYFLLMQRVLFENFSALVCIQIAILALLSCTFTPHGLWFSLCVCRFSFTKACAFSLSLSLSLYLSMCAFFFRRRRRLFAHSLHSIYSISFSESFAWILDNRNERCTVQSTQIWESIHNT